MTASMPMARFMVVELKADTVNADTRKSVNANNPRKCVQVHDERPDLRVSHC